MRKYTHLVLLLSIVCLSCASQKASKEASYKDPNQPVDSRVENLMSMMTLEEKVAQMCQYVGIEHIKNTEAKFKGRVSKNDDANGFYKNLPIDSLITLTEKGWVGSFLHVVTAEEANYLQSLAQKSRLQIPLLIGIDAIHGNGLYHGATIYPSPIGMASSFDLQLVRQASEETAREMRATGSQWTFTPNIDVARDPRWGRIGETFGEDPYLVSRMGVETIKGFQGEDMNGADKVAACAKHLIAGGEPANGTNASPMDVSIRTLREVHLPPYKAAVEEAKVFTGMTAHNELNGIPCHADAWLMTDLLRREYGFDGFIVSDWMDVERIHELHRYTPTMLDAYYESVNAGLDMHMHGPRFMEGIVELVCSGRLAEKKVDRACAAILEAKFRLGLFENPFVDSKKTEKVVFNKEHQKTALEFAEKSIVLLENKNLLPLDMSKYKNILVTGPNANSHAVLGDWTLEQPDAQVKTVLEGIQEVAKNKITFVDCGTDVRSSDLDKVEEAARAAKSADLAIVALGENPLRYQKTKTTGENIDRMSLKLLGMQEQLVKQIKATGIPTIVILVGGRPLSVNWIAKHADALIQAWEPGSFAGTAIANIITGEVNPSAKLPVSIPRHSGQIQMIYNHKPSQYFHKYKDGASTPLYAFGYGLNYSQFEFSKLKSDKKIYQKNENIEITLNLENKSNTNGTEVVQVYIRDLYSSATRPVKELKDFRRVSLDGGASTVVSFNITPDKLAYFNRNMKYGVEAGDFEIMVGNSSQDKDLQKIVLTVEGEDAPI